MKLFFVISAILFFQNAFAGEVIFVRGRERDGSYIELEKGGTYAHVAIRYGTDWLQAVPGGGVVLAKRLALQWVEPLVLVNGNVPEPSKQKVKSYLGKLYDDQYDWSDKSFYCSELVGKILGLEPESMRFDGRHWDHQKNLPWGEPGLSPDGILRKLLNAGWKIRR